MLGPWKRKNLAEYGIVTQCIAPMRVNDQYLTNVLLKINAKVSVFLGVIYWRYVLYVHFSCTGVQLVLYAGDSVFDNCFFFLLLLLLSSMW